MWTTAAGQHQPSGSCMLRVLCVILAVTSLHSTCAQPDLPGPEHASESEPPHHTHHTEDGSVDYGPHGWPTHGGHPQGSNPAFAPYLLPGEIPDGALKELFQEDWRVIGSGLDVPDFHHKIAQVAKTIYSAFSYHGHVLRVVASEAAPTTLDGRKVPPAQLASDSYSDNVLSDYNSVDVILDVSIDNHAWYPDLGYVAATDHSRLKNIMNAEGYKVVAWLCWQYTLTFEAKITLGHMPVPEYKSFLISLKVTGANLVPFTLQKQNVVAAVLDELLSFAAVFSVRLQAVDQTSPEPGQELSSADVSLLVQQDASALFAGQALLSVITDPLSTPLFDVRMAAAGLPVTASINFIEETYGDSISDQIIPPADGLPPLTLLQMAGLLVGIALLAAAAAAISVAVRRHRVQIQHTPRLALSSGVIDAKTHHTDVELAGVSDHGTLLHDQPLNPFSDSESSCLLFQQHPACARESGNTVDRLSGNFEPSSYSFLTEEFDAQQRQPGSRSSSSDSSTDSIRLSQVEFNIAQRQLTVKPNHSETVSQAQQAWVIDPKQIQICQHPRGGLWQLGSGSFGVVYKARKGLQDVAVKTIHSHLVSPLMPASEAAGNLDRELQLWKTLSSDKNLVQFYGSCEQGGKVLLVLEYMEGGDLRHAIKGLDARAEQLLWHNKGAQVALDVAQGLDFLHSHGVVHRDIKSGNVLLSKDFGQAKICDVGLAHIMGTTNTGQNVQATFAYAAPEMLLNKKCTEKVDIFSYGVLLWEIISQETPQRGLVRDLKVPAECPQQIADLVDRCLSDESASRPSAKDICSIIRSSLP